jgi:DNA-binding GntR family transcriptional regulator
MKTPPDKLTTPISRKQSLREIVHERVRGALLSGEIGAEERFSESQLAEGLGTSRAPIREAMRELEQEGLIVRSGQRGYVLRPVEPKDVRELGLLRSALERLAAGLTVQRASAAEIAELEEIVAQMAAAEQRSPAEGLEDLDTAFHEKLCRLAQHEALLGIWLSMRDRLQLALRAVNLSWDRAGFASSHELVMEAIRSGDPKQAEDAIETHILSGLDRLMSVSTPDEPTPQP